MYKRLAPYLGMPDFVKEIIKSLGIVFGDIGTSPIYTLTVIFLWVVPTYENVIGVLSLIIWTLVMVVSVEYAWLAMSLGKKGEGGTIVLKELLVPLLKTGRQVSIVTFLSLIGISLLIGDGVLTPAISILSAIEGFSLIPGIGGLSPFMTIFLSCCIAVGIFVMQSCGIDRVSRAFGPIMLVWFLILTFFGILSIWHVPSVLRAINPLCGIKFIMRHGLAGFFVLSEVILCATGGEALYADMGHLGRLPIIRGWCFVAVSLLCAYLGQGAFLIQHPHVKSVLYEMMLFYAPLFYVPFVCLSLVASIIGSQAMISGIFSIVYQGITTGLLPMFKVDYTSSKLRSQIYIGFVNWFLLIMALMIIIHFGQGHKLAAAYGLAVTGTMSLTGIMMTWIFSLKHSYGKAFLSLCVTFIDIAFFAANIGKIPYGGYWSLLIALVPLSVILIYTNGQRCAQAASKPMPLEEFLQAYEYNYQNINKIEGAALFFIKDVQGIEPYIVQTMFKNSILYDDNIMISVINRDDPFGVIGFFKGTLAPGLRIFEIHMGYMEVLDMEKILRNAGIEPKVIFYGIDDIVTYSFLWKIYAIIKRLTPSLVQFYRLPSHKLHGVVTVVEM